LVLEIRPAARVEVVPAEAANQERGQCFSRSGHNVGVSLEIHPVIIPIGSMYGIYGNIYHEYTPVMLAYTSTMDTMGLFTHYLWISVWDG
jgi:hypothetical protein